MTRIALHILLLESRKQSAGAVRPVIETRYPGSVVARHTSISKAQEAIETSIFDLVILHLDPLRAGHAALLRMLREHPTPMPTLLLVARADEERLHELFPAIPAVWELMHVEALSPLLLEHRVQKAISAHQINWKLSHLEQAFQSSLVHYRSLFDEVPDLIFLCDRSGCLLDVNARAVHMFQQPKERMIMRPIFDIFGIGREDFERLLNAAQARDRQLRDFEILLQPADQEPIYGLAHMVQRLNGAGRPVQFQGVVKDISPHKHLERQLRQREDQYRTLYELSRICSSSLRLNEIVSRSLEMIHGCCKARGTVLLLNRRAEELNFVEALGMPPGLRDRLQESSAALLGQDTLGRLAISSGVQAVGEEDHRNLPPVLAEWLRLSGPCNLLAVSMGRGNPTLPTALLLVLLDKGRPLKDVGELLLGLSKTLEMGMTNCFHHANLQEAERRYRDLWDGAPAYFISLLKGGLIIEINQTAVRSLGYSLPELIGKPLKKFIDPRDHELFERHHRLVVEKGEAQTYELRLVSKTDQVLIVSVNSEPLSERDGIIIGEKCRVLDHTEDREKDERLRDYADNLERMVHERTDELSQTMNFLNGILEGSTEYAIVGLDPAGRFLHYNRGAQLLFGYERESVVEQETLELLIDFDHGSWAGLEELLRTVDEQAEGALAAEAPMKTARGRHLLALLTINRLKEPAANNLRYVAIIRDITQQKEMEELVKHYTENLHQIIEAKTKELASKHVQLIQSGKLATLGEMATGIAHELNQPLSGIRTRAQFVVKAMERQKLEPPRIAQKQQEIIDLIDRMTRIINHMRIFARQDQQHFVAFNLSQSIEGALSLIGEQLRIHAIQIHSEIQESLPDVYGEPLQIEQVLLNLLSNARDAVDSRAEQTQGEEQKAPRYQKQLSIRARAATEREVCLEIQDNGTGMDEETRAKIFQPFFTTKPVGRGTGLGLSISYGIVNAHQGRFDVESIENHGTTFRIFLPIWMPIGDPTATEHAGAEVLQGQA